MNIPAAGSTSKLLPEAPREYAALIRGQLIHARDREPLMRASPAHGVPVSRMSVSSRGLSPGGGIPEIYTPVSFGLPSTEAKQGDRRLRLAL